MGLLGFLGGNKGGGTPKWAKKPMLEAFDRTRQAANLPFEPYTAPRVATLSPAQQQGIAMAVNAATSNLGGAAVNSAINLAQQAAAYRPLTVAPTTMTAAMLQPVPEAAAASIDREGVRDLTAGSFLGGDLSAYLNPYVRQVIDTTAADLNRQRDIQRQADSARALKAQAFGGSRQAVADAQTSEAFNNTMASTLAGLYSQGFDRASGLMMQDYDRALQAQQANQGVDASVVAQNAGFGQQTALANQANRYNQIHQNALLEQQAAQANMEAAMRAQELNQSAGLSAANLGLGAATQIGGFGKSQQEMALDYARAMLQAGDVQRAAEQAKLDAAYEDFLRKVNYPVQMAELMQGGGQMMAQGQAKPQTGLFDTVSKAASAFGNVKAFWPSKEAG